MKPGRLIIAIAALLLAVPVTAAGDGGKGVGGQGSGVGGKAAGAQAPDAPRSTPHAPTASPPPATPQAGTAAGAAKRAEGGYLPYGEPGLPETPGLLTVAGRVVGSLALVIGLIFVTALALKRFLGGKRTPTTSRKVTELVEVTPLGGKRYLYLIRVADRLLVVGAGGDRLALLSEITDPAVLDLVAATPRRSEFFGLLTRLRGKEAAAPEQAAVPG